MLKRSYINVQKEILKTIPVNPYELTEKGIQELRKSILFSILSLAVCMIVSLILFRWAFGSESMATDGFPIMFGKLAGYLSCLVVALWGLNKSTDYLLGTGLYWQLSVSDELQDEWELAQKRRAYSKAFEWIIYGAAGMFLAILAICGGVYAVTGALPSPPSFGVWVVACFMLIYVSALTPIIYIAWTLSPIEDESIIDRPKASKRERIEPLTSKQKRLKHLWTWGPIAVGLVVGILIALNS